MGDARLVTGVFSIPVTLQIEGHLWLKPTGLEALT